MNTIKEENIPQETISFISQHADAIAIIGVNIAIAAILVTMFISHSSRIDTMNSRLDATNSRIDNTYNMFYDLLKEVKKNT